MSEAQLYQKIRKSWKDSYRYSQRMQQLSYSQRIQQLSKNAFDNTNIDIYLENHDKFRLKASMFALLLNNFKVKVDNGKK